MKQITLLIVTILTFCSCSEYQKIAKSNDYQLVYKEAVKLYHLKDYQRALTLFDRVRNAYSGTSKSQSTAYYRAFCNYNLGDYLVASNMFSNFVRTYPESSYTEECLYMMGYCNYLASPNPRLDQQATKDALRDFQLYFDRYPNSQRKDVINKYMDELNDKLTYKSFLSASNYYHRERYKAAIISLRNCLKDYPNSQYREEIMHMIFESSYEMAVNSIPEKQLERYNDALEEYYVFTEEFPESKYIQELEAKHKNISTYLNKFQNQDEQ